MSSLQLPPGVETAAPTKLLLHSNAPWASTGYGQQVSLFTPKLAQHYDLTLSAFYGLEAARLDIGGIKVLPGNEGQYGNECIQGHALHTFHGDLRGGLVLSLMDVWVLDARIWRTMNVASWVPIDHAPAPPGVLRFFADSGAIPVAMSRFGQQQLVEAGFDALYVPHGIDTSVYTPMTTEDARAEIGFPEGFIIGVIAANKGATPPRKCFPELLSAFAAFHREHPDARLYLHTEITGMDHGLNLTAIINSLGIPEGAILYADQYRYRYDPLNPKTMAKLYAAFDVLMAPSRGEGFGLPTLEAQACGTPVIVSDFAASTEVCGSGWKVAGTPEWSPQGSWWFLPDVGEIVKALEKAYRLSDEGRQAKSEQAVAHAATYDADRVMAEHFLPALKQVEQRFEAREPVELAA